MNWELQPLRSTETLLCVSTGSKNTHHTMVCLNEKVFSLALIDTGAVYSQIDYDTLWKFSEKFRKAFRKIFQKLSEKF